MKRKRRRRKQGKASRRDVNQECKRVIREEVMVRGRYIIEGGREGRRGR